MKNDWKTEVVKKLPWSATFLIAAYFFFKYTNEDLVAWICFVIAIIALFLVIRFEYYEKIIDRQEKQIDLYIERAHNSQAEAMKVMSEVNTCVASSFGDYQKISEGETETK